METATENKKETYETAEVIKAEVNLQYHWYLFSFFIIYFGSFLIPGIIFMLFYLLFLVPYVMGTKSFILLFTELIPLLTLIMTPFVIIICYLLHLYFVAIITKWLWAKIVSGLRRPAAHAPVRCLDLLDKLFDIVHNGCKLEPLWRCFVATFTIKNIPQNLYEKLKQSAEINRRSINSEIIIT